MIRDILITLACFVALAALTGAMVAASKNPNSVLNREASGLLSGVAIAVLLTAVFGICAMVAT